MSEKLSNSGPERIAIPAELPIVRKSPEIVEIPVLLPAEELRLNEMNDDELELEILFNLSGMRPQTSQL